VIRSKLLHTFSGVILLSLLSWHCTKIDTTTIGNGLIPGVDNVNTFDTTLNVVANNFDSIPFNKECATVYPTDEHALGFLNDPLFGTTKATIFTELKPATFPFAFEGVISNRTLDSVVLVLAYTRTYGDTTLQQRVEVHQLDKTFLPDSNTCSIYTYNATVLGATTYTPAPRRFADTIKAFRDTNVNQLRIKISNSLGQLLLSQDTIKTDSAFKVLLKGFAIVPDNAGNALTYYNIVDSKTKLAIYYKYKRTGLSDTAVVNNFGLYNTDKSANTIVRSRAGAEINNVSNNNSNPAGDNFVYIQTSPGSFAQLKIPGLSTISNRIVHRAELIMEQVTPTGVDNFLVAPSVLFLDLKDSVKGQYHPLPCDFTYVSGLPDITTYGGYRTFVTVGGKQVARYIFNISRYVQKVITNKRTNATLRLWAPNYVSIGTAYVDECNISIPQTLFALNNVAQGRVKLVAGSTAANRMRLRIVYSRL
jgi:hypothetical protein